MPGTEVERLLVVIDADVKRMEQKLQDFVARNRKAAKDVESAWGKGIGPAAAKGFENLADHAGELVKSIPGVGAALGALGPAGLAAAAGVGAFALAMEQTEKAVDYAANLEKTAKMVGVTTTFLQEFNFAAKQSEVDTGAADEALKNLNASLGAVQGNLPRAKQLAKVFGDALKLSPDQLRGYHDVSELLPVIADRIRNAGSAAEQAAIARKLGIEELLPMLRQGAGGFNKLAREADDLGVVLDASTIEKAAEAKRKLNELDDVMRAQKAQTFAEYADTLVTIKTAFNNATIAALDFLAALTNTKPKSEKLVQQTQSVIELMLSGGGGFKTENAFKSYFKGREAAMFGAQKDLTDQLADEARRAAEDALLNQPARQFTPTKTGGGRETRDRTVEFDKQAQDALAASSKELADAQAALATTIEERTKFEQASVDAELSKHLIELEAQRAKIEETQIDAKKHGIDTNAKEQLAAIDLAEANATEAAIAKKMAIAKQALLQATEELIVAEQAEAEIYSKEMGAAADHASVMAQLADTAKERNAYEREALADRQDAERATAEQTLDAAKKRLDTAMEGSDFQAAQQAMIGVANAQQAIQNQRQTHADQWALLMKQQEGPIAKYQDSLKELNTLIEDAGVQAIKSLSDGLADAIVNAKSLGDVASNVFKQLITQILSAELQKNIFSPILTALHLGPVPGHAAGTFSSAAGLAWVGENGPELVNLPGGSQVIDNATLRNVSMTSRAPGGTTILFDNRGSIIWEQAARQLMAYADRAAGVSGLASIQAARHVTQADLARAGGRRLSA